MIGSGDLGGAGALLCVCFDLTQVSQRPVTVSAPRTVCVITTLLLLLLLINIVCSAVLDILLYITFFKLEIVHETY